MAKAVCLPSMKCFSIFSLSKSWMFCKFLNIFRNPDYLSRSWNNFKTGLAYHRLVQWNLIGMTDNKNASASRWSHRFDNPRENNRINWLRTRSHWFDNPMGNKQWYHYSGCQRKVYDCEGSNSVLLQQKNNCLSYLAYFICWKQYNTLLKILTYFQSETNGKLLTIKGRSTYLPILN